jgi:hypothetical protein
MAGSLEVATTTTDLRRPSSVRSFSRNSRTSRPRSPISAITFTSASAWLAIMPSKVDLPTPLPAKMPKRWPRPQGTKVSMALMPVRKPSRMRWRFSGCGGM